MSKEKQIEEMAELICDNKDDHGICSTDGCVCNYNCEYKYSAEALYNAGYRKQSEGEWKETKTGFHCSACRKKPGVISNRGAFLSKFCPHCGARMKGGEKE